MDPETVQSEVRATDVPRLIQTVRKKLGLTQKMFARSLNISLSLLRAWEKGQRSPSPAQLQALLQSSQSEQSLATGHSQDQDATPDFLGNADHVRLLLEGYRLSYGHQFNPTFATEISHIDPLPHQRIAVYEHMLPKTRLRFLLADDAGAGKTIMTGLYIREMLARRLLKRVLIVPPAGLVGNWEQELRRLFDLHATIITSSESRHTNPFTEPGSDLAIVSVSSLCGDRLFAYLQESDVSPYDLVVFDEAHKLSAYRDQDLRVQKTARFKLAEALAGTFSDEPRWQLRWRCQHLLLLSATPHMGKDIPYYYLWSLLEPEMFASYEAFKNCPDTTRQHYFLRRTKEEMVSFSGQLLYPRREAITMSYDLTQGAISEQTLYDEMTRYIFEYYNKAARLNRSAVRLAMSVFQRRLASSTWALLRSLLRREAHLLHFIAELEAGRMPFKHFQQAQQSLDATKDLYSTKTADEEDSPKDGQEENEELEQDLLQSTVATTLQELGHELRQVEMLSQLAHHVFSTIDDAKFEKLRGLIRDERYKDQKLLIFTEHRDTLDFLVSRLEGLGYTDRIASIHGGMEYRQREEAMLFFRRDIQAGGARFMIATDAAGEGINLQVCWLMVNYDLPWNPARLEQRMGRIHRYGQIHDPVYIFNLVAGRTREGRVMRTLLDKLERIKVELGSDKVYDVLGQLLEEVSLQAYFTRLQDQEEHAEQALDTAMTITRMTEVEQREQLLPLSQEKVSAQLPRLRQALSRQKMQGLLPGYVRQFLQHAAPLLHLHIEGSIEQTFRLQSRNSDADLWLYQGALASPQARARSFTISANIDAGQSIFLHPGEPTFERIRSKVNAICSNDARRGALFADSNAEAPYFYQLVEATLVRRADPAFPQLQQPEILAKRLLAFKQVIGQEIESCAVEELLLLRPLTASPELAQGYREAGTQLLELADSAARQRLQVEIERYRRQMDEDRASREEAILLGLDYLEIELLNRRARLRGKQQDATNAAHLKGEITKLEQHYASLSQRRTQALQALQREPELFAIEEIIPLACALVLPASMLQLHPAVTIDTEKRAMQIALAYERARGANVFDVSTPEKASVLGLSAWPGFDLLAEYPGGEQKAIEVKGRVGTGTIELSENEYGKACTLRDSYWLYVVFDCEKDYPRLVRVQDPFGRLLVRAKGSVLIESRSIFEAELHEGREEE